MLGRRIRVRGQVQGVGFRPFVWELARRHGVTGTVLNDAEGVLVEAAGEGLAAFEAALAAEAPPLARVDAVEGTDADLPPCGDFTIAASGAAGAETRVTPDAATCADCAAEIRDPSARRFGYPFTNCTNCGPRLTILRALPYDRARTTMAPFEMCAACRAEYEDPADRRFHAQPIACPACGPQAWCEADGARLNADPIATAARWLRAGRIVAIKGLGGFHLACDATNPAALALLRERKRRPAKPFALMAPLETVARHAVLDDTARARLTEPAAPIVLLPKAAPLPEGVAPGQGRLGWMLPYTPLHHLLLDAARRPLVMTSGNLSGEPQAIGDDEAREKLSGFADGFLMHDREIARRLDDGVEIAAPPMVLRRARGRVPGTLELPPGLPHAQVAAFGGQLKSAICLTKAGQAMLSHHLGDLDDPLTLEEFLRADADLAELLGHAPEAVAVDLHPEFRATRHGHARADALGVPVFEVQHHHAHMAAALGEAGWRGATAVGLVLDGLGLGPDGTVWGGEVLVGGYAGVARAAHLTPAPLVGGDRAQADPWRNAVVRLDAAGHGALAERLFGHLPLAPLRAAAMAGVNAPLSSSAGRLYDAVAACLGLCPERQSFEGEAAMALQTLSERGGDARPYPFGLGPEIDPAPMFDALARDLAAGAPPETIAARFEAGLAKAFASAARAACDAAGTDTVALSGGCFQNVSLLARVTARLDGLRLCPPGEVPANDGGLAFGQALVALARMESG
ncbi:carbamoyltransferase HypF [Jannaschia seohaensis]|uniref:Carbamoyltransferase HypF n=1 Tax=Jannaschia seohaensis TaxID=475081 RepID=A0A2Y9A162_9RHOB|nr:carbamoyltransferase HypF [Jannaschia seohaensis]PWJ21856.1 hydrogenase maturation protein HypF [Jannaschia seohaensis]SSA38134.1 hydrogenase maturation protein HypF [Jannaschia seohaensis]